MASSEDASEFMMDPDTVICGPQAGAVQVGPVDLARVFTPSQLAEHWGVTTDSVRGLIHAGNLAAFRVGPRLFRVRADAVEAFEQAIFKQIETTEERHTIEQREANRKLAFSALRTSWKRQATSKRV